MRWVALTVVVAWVLHQGFIVGMLAQPWAPWWLSGHSGQVVAAAPEDSTSGPTTVGVVVVPGDLSPITGFVSDTQRYQLARAVGWHRDDAIIATAVSLAEDGSGDPAAMSGRNSNGTFDLGLWQINSAHWPKYGGQAALIAPINNAHAAFGIKAAQGWCAWSTYGPGCQYHGCGPPCYRDFLGRARTAADVQSPPGAA